MINTGVELVVSGDDEPDFGENDGFEEWYRENEMKFHRCMFTAEEIALAAWYAGAKQILMIQMRNRVSPLVSEDSG